MQSLKLHKFQFMAALLLLVGFAFGVLDPATALAGIAIIPLTTSTAQLGNGTVLQISAGSPTAFITVNNVRNLAWDNGTNPETEVTNLTSVSKEFLAGLPDAGTLTGECDLDMGDAGQAAIHAAKLSRIACDVKIILPGGTTPNWTARGYVKKFDKSTAVDGVVKAALEIRITGAWTAA